MVMKIADAMNIYQKRRKYNLADMPIEMTLGFVGLSDTSSLTVNFVRRKVSLKVRIEAFRLTF